MIGRGRPVIYSFRPVASIFVVEDDQHIRELVTAALVEDGHTVDSAGTAMESLDAIVKNGPDLVLLDLGLPDLDGSELLKLLRAVSNVPIIVATARDDERDIVTMLDAGADEYVVKPYSGLQIQARVRAMLRRFAATSGVREVGDLVIDVRQRTAHLGGDELDLRRKEYEILAFLAGRPGEVVTREELFAEVWRQPYAGADKTIDVHISWLRQKLGESAAEARYLHTVRGVGFRLIDPE